MAVELRHRLSLAVILVSLLLALGPTQSALPVIAAVLLAAAVVSVVPAAYRVLVPAARSRVASQARSLPPRPLVSRANRPGRVRPRAPGC